MIRRMVCLLLALLLSMPLPLAGAEEIVQADTLAYGDESDAVKELQTRLKALCYYRGPLSGEFGSLTRDAVKAVQEAYGLPVTGKADPDTLSVIYGECYRPLQYNDQGEDVERLQERLGELGYYTGKVSGKYLNGTKEGIMTFQGEFGLPETGKADVETLHILFSAIVRPTASPSPMPSPTPTLGPRQPFSKTLKYGSTGDDVQKVQQRLMDLGFFTFYKTTQGYYRQTQEAVQAFQEYNGLFVTGQVDESTWNALFNDETVVPQSGEPKPTPEPVPVPYRIEVDVNNQITKIWQYDPETRDYTIHLKSFLCSTGTKSNPSGVGTYTLTDRRSRWCFFSKWGGSKAQYWVKIDEEIAFHSLIYADYDEMTLKTSSYDALGKRASHGCIRLTVADAKWIYDNCFDGTEVIIHEDGISDPELKAAIQPGKLDRSVMLPKTTPVPTQPPVFDGSRMPEGELRSLSSGKSGEDVYWLQMKLKELGYYEGTPTGTYLGGTQKAVKAYQRAMGLSVDGNCGRSTWNSLMKLVEEENATPTPEPTFTPAPSATPEPVVMPAETAPPQPQ